MRELLRGYFLLAPRSDDQRRKRTYTPLARTIRGFDSSRHGKESNTRGVAGSKCRVFARILLPHYEQIDDRPRHHCRRTDIRALCNRRVARTWIYDEPLYRSRAAQPCWPLLPLNSGRRGSQCICGGLTSRWKRDKLWQGHSRPFTEDLSETSAGRRLGESPGRCAQNATGRYCSGGKDASKDWS